MRWVAFKNAEQGPRQPSASIRCQRTIARATVVVAQVALPFALLALTGCRHENHPPTELDRLAERRLWDRGDSMRFVLSTLAKREAESPANLRDAAGFIAEDIARDARRTAENITQVEDYLRRDLERWIERQDDYLREAGRILWGQPETIPRTAIIMFL